MDNMGIWSAVDVTDPKYTKDNTQGGRKATSINGLYMAKQATERFGPIGTGWGYEIVEDRFDDAGPILSKADKPEVLCQGKLHTIKLRLWYMDGDKEKSVYQYGHTPYIYSSKWGFTVDNDYAKKTLTDAMKKCLSLLGFCADIYLGLFDDQGYQQAAWEDGNEKRQEEELAKQESKAEEWRNQVGAWIADIKDAKDAKSMLTVFNKAARRANAKADESAMKAIAAAKTAWEQSSG